MGRIHVVAGWIHTAVGWLYAAVGQLTVCFNLTFLFFCSHTAVNNIHLVLYGDLHVQQALALVAASEAYSEVLQLEAEPRVEG